MTTFAISGHAVEQYRTRVLGCPERKRSAAAIRRAMKEQITALDWRLAGGETFAVEAGPMRQRRSRPWEWVVSHVTHTFLIERSVVVTVLGYGMRTDRTKNRKKRRRRKVARGLRAAARP